MLGQRSSYQHPVPETYHETLHIGEYDRRGNVIDFKTPPVIVDSPRSITDYQQIVLKEHTAADKLPMVYATNSISFMVLKPTALPYRVYIREQLIESGLLVREEFELNNFMRLADSMYELDPSTSFHWQWRVIMRVLHVTGTQDQNTAIVFLLEGQIAKQGRHDKIMDLKKRIRSDMGETPVVVRYLGSPEIALGIHHLHSPDTHRMEVEYNALMHAKNRTSIFS